jgi:hypothetical protein
MKPPRPAFMLAPDGTQGVMSVLPTPTVGVGNHTGVGNTDIAPPGWVATRQPAAIVAGSLSELHYC